MSTVVLNPSSTVASVGWVIVGSQSTVHESLAHAGGSTTGVEANGDDRFV